MPDVADEDFKKPAVQEAIVISQLAEDVRPKLWTKRMFRLYGILLLGYLCIVLQGYDGSLMGAINAMVCHSSIYSLLVIWYLRPTLANTCSYSSL